MQYFGPLMLLLIVTLSELRYPKVTYGHRTKSKLPISGENELGRGGGHKARKTDCHFGRTKYELEDVWHPNLGPPFGVMYCIQCECHPVHKKRRIIGKVKCRNIKNDCVEPACDDPVLLPESCCKTCPNKESMPSEGPLVISGGFPRSDEGHEYVSLMIPVPKVQLNNSGPVLASARFTFHKRNLHYSIHYVGPEQPSAVSFADEKGNIIEEHETHVTHLYNSSYKVCGVWSKIPKSYRKPLRDDGLYVGLTSESFPDGVVIGQVVKIPAVKTETFSAMLLPAGAPPEEPRRGGLAIISTASINNAVHFLLIFHNLFQDLNEKDSLVMSVRLESLQRDDVDGGTVIEEVFVEAGKMKHLQHSLAAEFKMTCDARAFRHMARGRLLLTIAPKHWPDRKLTGIVAPKTSCNVYHAILSAATDSVDEEAPSKPGAGQAVLYLTDDGSVAFRIQVDGLMSPVRLVRLEIQNKKRWRTIHDLTSEYRDGWANGTLSRLSTRDIELLMNDELYVSIGTDKYTNHVRGAIKQRLYGDAHSGDFPLLLRDGSNVQAVGQAWMSVDESCRLYYEVVVSGLGGQKRSGKRDGVVTDEIGFVELLDMETGNNIPPLDTEKEMVKHEFSGTEVDDVVDYLEKPDFERLVCGNALLHVSINSTANGNLTRVDLRSRINHLHIPESCRPTCVEIPHRTYQDPPLVPMPYQCFHDGQFVEDGSQWTASHNVCVMCSCQRGRIVCDPVMCPPVSCANPQVLPGDCCPSCCVTNSSSEECENETTRGCYVEGDKMFRRAGSKWYPYVPPFGFSSCAVCECNATTLKVNCTQITCPLLSCPEKEAYREHQMSCCKVCPKVKGTVPPEELHDAPQNKTRQELLAEGGCKFGPEIMPNGKVWHPRVQPFGEMKCFKCFCKDGKIGCSRHRCPTLPCQNKVVSENECCPKCLDNSSSSSGRGSGVTSGSNHPISRHRGNRHGT